MPTLKKIIKLHNNEKTLTGLGEQLGEDRSCTVLPPAKQKRWSWSFYGCASSGAALLIELCFAVRAAGLKGEGKIQISAGETPQRCSRHLPSGLSLRVLMAAPIQPSAESAGGFPGELRGLWNKHRLTLHLIFSPFIFWIEFRGGEWGVGVWAQAIHTCSKGKRRCSSRCRAPRGGFGGAASTHRARLPSPRKHERHFWLFRIFIFRAFFLLVHARLSFIYRE